MKFRRLAPAMTWAALLLAAIFSGTPAFAQEYGADFGRFIGISGDHARYDTEEEFGDRGPFILAAESRCLKRRLQELSRRLDNQCARLAV